MKKSKKLKELKRKLKDYNNSLNDLDRRKIGHNGKLDFQVVLEMQRLQTDIAIVEKQINFVNQGKHYLGEKIGSKNANKYLE